MRDRLGQAAADGLVLGVKWSVALVIVAIALAVLAGDYQTTRANAAFAAQTLQQLLQQSQVTQAQPPRP